MSVKLVSVWVLGALLLLAGSWVVQNLELTVGVSGQSYILAMLTAFVLFLLAGLCWISVAVATRRRLI
ncbi:MAG: hypothetical protein DRH37_11205 [Deltaproteobacteria bacterium]|nr:MAG: hypothetical protein DRH37_11205 [Deltaproteobacteria bacterium]